MTNHVITIIHKNFQLTWYRHLELHGSLHHSERVSAKALINPRVTRQQSQNPQVLVVDHLDVASFCDIPPVLHPEDLRRWYAVYLTHQEQVGIPLFKLIFRSFQELWWHLKKNVKFYYLLLSLVCASWNTQWFYYVSS